MPALSKDQLSHIYYSAASVRNQTGVDPAIIAAIAATETGSSGSESAFTLGISSASPSGRGSSGQTWGSPNTYGGTQPAGFWVYGSGADAAAAFANFINANSRYAAAVPYMNDASQFFDPKGTFATSGYYTPTSGEAAAAGGVTAAEIAYDRSWLSIAQQYNNLWSNFVNWATGVANNLPSMSGNPNAAQTSPLQTIPGIGTIPVAPGQSVAGATAQAAGQAIGTWQQSLQGILGWLSGVTQPGTWWTILLFGGAMLAILLGVLFVFRQNFIPMGQPGAPRG